MDALDIPWEDIFKPGASIAFSKFNKWVQVVFGVYIPHIQYLVKPHSSPWTSTSTTNRYNSQYEWYLKINTILLLFSNQYNVVYKEKDTGEAFNEYDEGEYCSTHRILFYRLHQQTKSSASKVKTG